MKKSSFLTKHDDPEKDEDEDNQDQVHEAAPGDLGLAEAITILTTDIDRLAAQDAVLRILRKSKASLEREIRRKELQRQQYVIQESDNSLYGRSTIKIKSIMVGKEDDGREYAVYVIEVQRKAGEQMPAANSEDVDAIDNKKDIMTRFYNSVTDGMEDILGNIPVLDQLSVAGQNLLSAATNQLITMPATISEDPLTAAEAEAELNAFEDRELEPFV
ncbi:hypothetical protein DID88_010387 [Monilinia fructigena]|uniref:Uncharacterized protein n=1 Tax=Monilinia fructigena TaxID=38457 RepID=A0A395ICM3_9HELO|nr:hypothetical protein DID88_010387 [Monilinia fructigena]